MLVSFSEGDREAEFDDISIDESMSAIPGWEVHPVPALVVAV